MQPSLLMTKPGNLPFLIQQQDRWREAAQRAAASCTLQ